MAAIALNTIPASPDLFGTLPRTGANAPLRCRQPIELQVAGALCRQLRRKLARREKQRIAHLICLNLVSMLKRPRVETAGARSN